MPLANKISGFGTVVGPTGLREYEIVPEAIGAAERVNPFETVTS